ncbi:MAG: AAA family ATPase, partial [Chloroflexota bacterium]
MHITELRIKNYRQFQNIHLDFCDPETGKPLDKICFIGANGTGKSTLLDLLSQICQTDSIVKTNSSWLGENGLICWRVEENNNSHFILKGPTGAPFKNMHLALPAKVGESKEWNILWSDDRPFNPTHPLFSHFSPIGKAFNDLFLQQIALNPNSTDLAVHSLPDGVQIKDKIPKTSLNNALSLNNHLPAFHQSNSGELVDFWNFLIYLIKKRERDSQAFLRNREIRSLSVGEALDKFDQENPEILSELAQQWNLILEQAGLEFDVENAKI